MAASIPSRTLRDREVDPVHRPEHRVIERIEADRHPLQSRRGQRPRERPQRRSVRRQGQVDLAAIGSPDRGQHLDEVRQIAAHERLATGDPQLLDPERHERPSRPFDLLEAQDLVARQERVVLPEDLLGHAIGAPEIAPIRDRDAQIAHRAPERVGRSGPSIEGGRGIHRVHGSRERPDARRYHRLRPLVPLANCTVPTPAATMRPSNGCRGDPSRRARMRIATHGSDRYATGLPASLGGRAWRSHRSGRAHGIRNRRSPERRSPRRRSPGRGIDRC